MKELSLIKCDDVIKVQTEGVINKDHALLF